MSAQNDPEGMIRGYKKLIIDEVQRAPELLLAIKKSVDEDRSFGRFLLTGSANIMKLPNIADSLAGRMETLTLLPLSQNELAHQACNWIDSVYNDQLPQVNNLIIGDDLIETVLKGGYPEAISRTSSKRRKVWSRQYLDAIVQRDVKDIANVDKLDQLPRFLNALSQTVGQLCNYSKIGGQLNLDGKTVARYIGIFENMYLLQRVQVWSSNRLKRVIKTPKLQFIDSGLLSTQTGISIDEIKRNKTRFGSILETFVYGELLKHKTTCEHDCSIMFYRDTNNVEVDFVIENALGNVIGIEVKASASIGEKDLVGLRKLSRLLGNNFIKGIIFYDGAESMPVGDNIWALPVSTLWGTSQSRK